MSTKKREEFGILLKDKRVAAGLSQGDVAKALKWSTNQFVSNIERGIAFPPIDALKAMAKMYKVPAQELYNQMEEATIEMVTKDLQRRFHSSRK